ncbi:MAG: hypothetical protein GF311_28515 [Candidatus Lokiarchaeota archaeon]|nr:hypothetical protein [Candidatus Lokiarchaeota archaeon]
MFEIMLILLSLLLGLALILAVLNLNKSEKEWKEKYGKFEGEEDGAKIRKSFF